MPEARGLALRHTRRTERMFEFLFSTKLYGDWISLDEGFSKEIICQSVSPSNGDVRRTLDEHTDQQMEWST
jgi:hypothetical protein